MEGGVRLFHEVIELEKPRIYIKVDTDVDGYTSSGLIQNFISYLNPKAEIEFGYSFQKEHGLTFKLLS